VTYWLDYSAARLNGATIKAAGYGGVIRYVGGGNTKHTVISEYRSILAAGLGFMAVCEVSTGDADGGFARGAENARSAKAHCDQLGYEGLIFFCNDRTTVNAAAFRAYLDGAASVLGKARVGAYGFGNAMDAAKGHASAYWQAGRRADVRAHVHIWQDNNTQVKVGGITCDRNLMLKTITTEDDDMQLSDKLPPIKMADGETYTTITVADALIAAVQIAGGNGKPVAPASAHPQGPYNGRILALDDIETKVDGLAAKLDGLQVSGGGSVAVDLDALADKLADKLAARLSS
jgi:glycoside hydrolase-like protein